MLDVGAGDNAFEGPLPVALFTLDLDAEAFTITDADLASTARPPAMRFGDNLLQGCRVRAHAGGTVIVVRIGWEDPLEGVCFLRTDDYGRMVGGGQTLGGRSLAAGVDHGLVDGAEYAFLWSVPGNAPGANDHIFVYWQILQGIANRLGGPHGSSEFREEIERVANAPPFMRLRAQRYYPIAPGETYPGQRPPFFTSFWAFIDDDGRSTDNTRTTAASVLLELLAHQAGVSHWQGFSLIHQYYLRKLFDGFAVDKSNLNKPGDAPYNLYYLMLRRPAVGSVYLAELFDYELRRRRRNTNWAASWVWRVNSIFEACHSGGQPIPELHRHLVLALTRLHAADPIAFAEKQRDWAYGVARKVQHLLPDDLNVRGLANAVQRLTNPGHQGVGVTEPSRATELWGTPYGISVSPLYEDLYAQVLGLPSNFSTPSAPPGAEFSKWHPVSYTDLIAKLSASYVQHYLVGLLGEDLKASDGRTSVAEVLFEEEVEIGLLVARVRASVERLLRRRSVRALTLEGIIGGDRNPIFMRRLSLARAYGADWYSLAAGEGASSETTSAEPSAARRLLDAAKVSDAVIDTLTAYHKAAGEELIWQLLQELGASRPGAPPATQLGAMVGQLGSYLKGVTTYTNWVGNTTTLASAIGGGAGGAPTGATIYGFVINEIDGGDLGKVVVDLVAKRGNTRETLLPVVLHRVAEVPGGIQAIKTDELASEVSQVYDFSNAFWLKYPAFLDAFCNLAGMTISLASAPDEWQKARGSTSKRLLIVAQRSATVFSSVKSVATATRLIFQERAAASASISTLTGALEVTESGAYYVQLASRAAGVEKLMVKFGTGATIIAGTLEMAVMWNDSDNAWNRASAVGDTAVIWSQRTRFLFVGVGTVASAAALCPLLAPWAGPIAIGCGMATAAIDFASTYLESEYYDVRATMKGILEKDFVWVETAGYKSSYRIQLERLEALVGTFGLLASP